MDRHKESLNARPARARLVSMLSPLSPTQHVVVASATYFFLFTLFSDLVALFLAPLAVLKGIFILPFALMLTAVAAALPCYLVLRLYAWLRGHTEQPRGPRRALMNPVGWGLLCLGAATTLGFAFAALYVVECFWPVTAVPFVTTITATLLILLGETTLSSIPAGRRLALIAAFVLAILSLRYVDLLSSKPFARHLYQIHRGMSGAEVEKIMSSHLKDWNQPESEHYLHLNPGFTGEVWYRHTTEGWGNADWGKVVMTDGRVVDVEVCICD